MSHNNSQLDLSSYKLNSPSYVLPSIDQAPDVIKFGLYTWELMPLVENEKRKIRLSCTRCSHAAKQYWPLNSTNLRGHWNNRHAGVLLEMKTAAVANATDKNRQMLRSKIFSTVCHLSLVANDETDPFIERQAKRRHPVSTTGSVSKKEESEFYRKFIGFAIQDKLPMSAISGPNFGELLAYANLCEDDELPDITQESLKERVRALYQENVNKLKARFAQIESGFAVTIDEKVYDEEILILKVKVHFVDEKFIYESHTIGHEAFQLSTPRSKLRRYMYDRFHAILSEHGVVNRIVSITRDNSKVLGGLIDLYMRDPESCSNFLLQDQEIQCFGSVVSEAVEAFLSCTYFRSSGNGIVPEAVFEDLESMKAESPQSTLLSYQMKNLSWKVRNIVQAIMGSGRLYRKFHGFVTEREMGEKKGYSRLTVDTQDSWTSTYKMLDRFLYFREEVSKTLGIAESQLGDQDSYDDEEEEREEEVIRQIKDVSLSAFDWNLLTTIRDFLAVFWAPMKSFSKGFNETISLYIPFAAQISKELEKWNSENRSDSNPFLAKGIQKSRDLFRRRFPIHSEDIGILQAQYLATVLDPRLKLKVFETLGFPEPIIAAIKSFSLNVFRSYEKKYKDTQTNEQQAGKDTADQESISGKRIPKAQMGFFVHSTEDSEFERYISEKREYMPSSYKGFYRMRKTSFPVIHHMARDVLAIQAFSNPANSIISPKIDPESELRGCPEVHVMRAYGTLNSSGHIRDGKMIVESLFKSGVQGLESHTSLLGIEPRPGMKAYEIFASSGEEEDSSDFS